MSRAAKKAKPMPATYAPLRCLAPGDFGHTNLYGSPHLKFGAACGLMLGHDGKHECALSVRVAPSFESSGLGVEPKSVEVVGAPMLRWDLRPEAAEAHRWSSFVRVWKEIGFKARQVLR